MTKKILQLDEQLFEGVIDRIHIPKDPPKMVLIAGPCRVGTTALANVFAHAGYISYMQPIKSIRRAIEEGVEIPEFNIANDQEVVVSKETFGAKSESEFFDPIDILIKAGYPREKIHLIGIMREPASTLTSWTWMWEEVSIDGFVRAYKQINDVVEKAKTLGIATTSYIHEAIRDNNSALVVAALFNKIFGESEVFGSIVDWTSGPNFDGDKKVRFFDEPPERFVHAVKTWGGYEYRELIADITKEQEVVLEENGVFKIYKRFLDNCELGLGIRIRKYVNPEIGNFVLETKDTDI